jgi:hypothetical protein
MGLLIWYGKHGDVYVLARDTEEEKRAYLYLFKIMDDNCFYTCGLDGDQVDWYAKAKEGDAKAAKWLIDLRSQLGYEYERVEKEYVVEP